MLAQQAEGNTASAAPAATAPEPVDVPAAPASHPCACGAAAVHVCGGCRVAAYCSPACQRAAWPAHQVACRAAKAAPRMLTVFVVGEDGGAGRVRVLTDEASIHRLRDPCMYAGDEASHVAHPDGLPYEVAGLVVGGPAFVVGRRWTSARLGASYISCVPLVCATRAEAVKKAARLPRAGDTEILEVTVE